MSSPRSEGVSGAVRRLVSAALAGQVILAGFALLASAGPVRAANPAVCHADANYLVIGRERDEDVGTDFLVRKAEASKACAFQKKEGDFTVGGPEDAYFFVALKGNLLLLDDGTGPSRTLIVYDLNTRQKVLEAPYSDDGKTITDQAMTFWMQTGEANAANCKRFKEYQKSGFGAVIETRTVLDFASASLNKGTQTRCTATQ